MHRQSVAAACLLLCIVLSPAVAGAQTARARTDTVLFVCEHGTVKSLLAKVLFERYAKEVGLSMIAVSRGTKADSVVPAWMQQNLMADRVSLGSWTPRALQASDLKSASYVVSFDVPDSATSAARAPRALWNALPSVSTDYASGRDAINVRVRMLVDSLKRARQR